MLIKKGIRLKLIIGFLIGVLSVGLFSIYSNYKFSEAIDSVNGQAGILKSTQNMAADTKDSFNILNIYLYTQSPAELENLRSRYGILTYNARKHLEELKSQNVNIGQLEQLENYSLENDRILQEMIYAHDLKLSSGNSNSQNNSLAGDEKSLLQDSQDVQYKVQVILEKIINDVTINFDRTILEYQRVRDNARILLIVIIVYSAGLAIIIANSLSKPISTLRDIATEVGKGNLNIEINVKRNDELGELANEFNKMVYNLKELDNEKDEFIAIAAHELKNPISAIKSFAQLMASEKVINNKTKLKECINFVGETANDLYNLTINLVDSSRIRLGKFEIHPQQANLNVMLKDIDKMMGIIITERKIKSIFNIDKDLPEISTDPERLMQVIRNLIINAIHYTPEGGTIEFNVYKKGESIEFAVRDTGIGIPKEKQDKIFTRFYQAGRAPEEKASGSGLGLSICKGIIEMMNGKIWFESVEGKGTTFFFNLPIEKKE